MPEWSPCECDIAKCPMSAGATPICFSDSASGFFMNAVMMPFGAVSPFGSAAIRSGLPLSHSSQPFACRIR